MAPVTAHTVLVVEDHEDTSELYVEVLRSAGFAAHAVRDITSAHVLLADVHFDVLVADYELAGGTAAELMSLRPTPKVCILLTGHRAEDVHASGFHVVLKKPIEMGQLVEAIRAHIDA